MPPGIFCADPERRASSLTGIDRRVSQVWCSTFKDKDRFYTKRAAWRHLRRVLPVVLTLCLPGAAQQGGAANSAKDAPGAHLSAGDVEEVIARYRRDKPAEQVAVWSRWSATASCAASPAFRDAVLQKLPTTWLARRRRDPGLEAQLKTLFHPLLTLYGRHYTLFIIDTRRPAVIIDSGALLILTTGLLARASNDDELLGFVCHEVAHAQFAERSVAAKELYAALLVRGEAQAPGANAALRELARVELECDAVAARTLFVLGRDATQFVSSIERINREFPEETNRASELGADWHPPTATRMAVVKALGANAARGVAARTSQLLRDIQTALRERRE